MARAKAQGKRISAAPLAENIQAGIGTLYAQGNLDSNQISKQLKIGYGTAWKYVQRVKAGHFASVRSIHPPDGSWSSLCYWRVMGALREGTVNFPAITPGTTK